MDFPPASQQLRGQATADITATGDQNRGADIRKLSSKMDKPALAMDERLAMQEKRDAITSVNKNYLQ